MMSTANPNTAPSKNASRQPMFGANRASLSRKIPSTLPSIAPTQ
jgi:hypothetical protein